MKAGNGVLILLMGHKSQKQLFICVFAVVTMFLLKAAFPIPYISNSQNAAMTLTNILSISLIFFSFTTFAIRFVLKFNGSNIFTFFPDCFLPLFYTHYLFAYLHISIFFVCLFSGKYEQCSFCYIKKEK